MHVVIRYNIHVSPVLEFLRYPYAHVRCHAFHHACRSPTFPGPMPLRLMHVIISVAWCLRHPHDPSRFRLALLPLFRPFAVLTYPLPRDDHTLLFPVSQAATLSSLFLSPLPLPDTTAVMSWPTQTYTQYTPPISLPLLAPLSIYRLYTPTVSSTVGTNCEHQL